MNYCMECGTKLEMKFLESEGKKIPYCSNCGEYRFPVFNTAVSMIVMNASREKVLLIKQYGRDFYILVAGYVNKGEDAEEAVRREVMEEMGLHVRTVEFNRSHYYAPSNTLMLNFAVTVEEEEPHPNWEVDSYRFFSVEEAKKKIRRPSLAQEFLDEYFRKNHWRYPGEDVAPEYFQESVHPGRVEKLLYETETSEKKAYVYLPCGYQPEDAEERYPVLYLLHGGGGSAESFLGGENGNTRLKRMLDNMIERQEIPPMIVVTPGLYSEKTAREEHRKLSEAFCGELTGYLVPSVEKAYAGIIKSRNGRAVGGFSMGGVTTWSVFSKALRQFCFFIPMSGDSWILQEMGGAKDPEKTAAMLANAVRDQGCDRDDFRIFAAVGTQDRAKEMLLPQIHAMEKHPEMFKVCDDYKNGNLRVFVAEGKQHDIFAVRLYLQTALKAMFPCIKALSEEATV